MEKDVGIRYFKKFQFHPNRTSLDLEEKWKEFDNEPNNSQPEIEKMQFQTGTKTSCEVCHKAEDEHKTLLCDGCDAEYHMYCLNPPLDKIPKGRWFCSSCLENGIKNKIEEDDQTFMKEFEKQKPKTLLTGKPQRDVEFVNKIRRALQSLGGKATGEQISQYLIQNEGINQEHKILKYRINAVLSSKTYMDLFEKEFFPPSPQRRASVWLLKTFNQNLQDVPEDLVKESQQDNFTGYDPQLQRIHEGHVDEQYTEEETDSSDEFFKKRPSTSKNRMKNKKIKLTNFPREKSEEEHEIQESKYPPSMKEKSKSKKSPKNSKEFAQLLKLVLEKLGKPSSSEEIVSELIEMKPEYAENIKVIKKII